jgi:hypothetical protein
MREEKILGNLDLLCSGKLRNIPNFFVRSDLVTCL